MLHAVVLAVAVPEPDDVASGSPLTTRRVDRLSYLRAALEPGLAAGELQGVRIAVISDIHGNLPALRAVRDHINRRGADIVINLGDCVTAPLWPAETLDFLGEWEAPTVRGNHDRWLNDPAKTSRSIEFVRKELPAGSRRYLAALPGSLAIEDVLAVHGTPASDEKYLLEDAVDDRLALAPASALEERLSGIKERLVLCGHSHLQHAAALRAEVLIVNPGSVGCPRSADNADAARNEAGSPHARYAIVERVGRHWSVEFHAVVYDWDSVAARAMAVGRADWAAGFLGRS